MTLINPNVIVGKNVTFYPGVMLWGDGCIRIGNDVDIGKDTVIYAKAPDGGVTIGDHTVIAASCYIIDSNHGTKSGILIQHQSMESQKIEIGQDVWIAAGCQIVKGASIGNGAVIGAGSVVNKHIPENAIAVGAPAKVVKYRR